MPFRIRRTNSTAYATNNIRYTNSNKRVRVEFSDTAAHITERVSGSTTVLDTNSSAGLTEDVWYNVRVVADGTSIKVWLAEDGEMPNLIFDETVAAANESSSKVGFQNTTGSTVEYDDIWLIGASLNNTTTYAYNTANELTSMTGPNGTTTFSYDELGRMTNKSRGSFSADYSWHYNGMLTEVDTDFPGESDVTYMSTAATGSGGRGRRGRYDHVQFWNGHVPAEPRHCVLPQLEIERPVFRLILTDRSQVRMCGFLAFSHFPNYNIVSLILISHICHSEIMSKHLLYNYLQHNHIVAPRRLPSGNHVVYGDRTPGRLERPWE